MKNLGVLISFVLLLSMSVVAQTEFTLDPSQSMLMTGKGPGQDATINPYIGQDCYAVVENLGQRTLSVRIQKKGTIIEEVSVSKGETKKVKLLKDQELYLDPNSEGKTKARVSYESISKD
ncbi:MAG: hypothetical protein AB8B53_14765 [Flavobacteriales bacterium]